MTLLFWEAGDSVRDAITRTSCCSSALCEACLPWLLYAVSFDLHIQLSVTSTEGDCGWFTSEWLKLRTSVINLLSPHRHTVGEGKK